LFKISRAEKVGNPLGDQFFWGLFFGELLVGVLLVSLFWWLNSAILGTVFLCFGIALIVTTLLRIVSQFLISLPDGHCKRLAGAIALVLTALYHIISGQSVIWIALSWVFLIFGVLGGIAAVQRILIEVMLLSTLLKHYKAKTSAKLPLPLVYILAEPGFGAHYAHRIATKVVWSILKHRGQRLIHFLVSDSVRRYSADFQNWLVSQAAAFVVVRFPHGLADENFEKMVVENCQHCLGKVFLVYLRPEGERSSRVDKGGGILEVSSSIRSLQEIVGQEGVIATLTDELAAISYPIAESDSRLPEGLRPLIQQIAQSGLSPLATSYLRFRLSHSDVERLLCLLDCIEVLIKCSAIVLLVTRWNRGIDSTTIDVSAQLTRPSLGHWTYILRELSKETAEDELEKTVSTFWHRPLLHEAPKKLISDVNGSGLAWQGELPRSHLAWLDWFVWLRNATRGHGVVEEKLASPLWHGFHETFLEMTRGLKPLVFSSAIAVLKDGREPSILQGWDRWKYLLPKPSDETEQLAVPYLLRKDSEPAPPLLLYPFMISHSDSVLLWNSMRGDAIEYIDYGSGKLQRFKFPDTDPYNLWKAEQVKLS
jgi:hypothetical protein